MASLGNLTKRIAAAPFKLAVGTAKNVGGIVKGAVLNNIGFASLKPSNIIRSTLEASGLGGIVPATLGFEGGGKAKKGGESAGKPSTVAAPPTTGGGIGGGITTVNIENLLGRLVELNTKSFNTLEGIYSSIENTNRLLQKNNQTIADYIRQSTLANIEARRESAKPGAAAPAGPEGPQKGAGGILGKIGSVFSSIFGFFKGLLSVLTAPIRMFGAILSAAGSIARIFGSIFGFFTGLGKTFMNLIGLLNLGRITALIAPIGGFIARLGGFLLRLAGPIGIALGVLLSLESKDWEALLGKITGAFKALSEGDFLTAILNIATFLPELLIRSLGRLSATILEFFGFKDAADSIRNFLDTFDLAKTFKDAFNFIWNLIKDSFTKFTDLITEFFSDWDIITPIKDAFNFVWDGVTNLFTSVKDKVTEILGFDLVGTIGGAISSVVNSVWKFFSELPSKAADYISGFLPDWLKDSFKKLFGRGTTPTPPAAGPALSAPPTPESNVSPAVNVVPSSAVIPSATQPATTQPQPTTEPLTRAGQALVTESGAPPQLAAALDAGIATMSRNTGTEFNQRSVNMGAARDMTAVTPIVVNNVNNNPSGGGGNGQTSHRLMGSPRTAPNQSHIDRALYGNGYGAGYA